MPKPSYSFDNVVFTSLDGSYQYGGRPRNREEHEVYLETDSGAEFIYLMFQRRTFELKWRLTSLQLAAFENLHEISAGRQNPFYFSITGQGSSDSIYVRKEMGLDFKELDEPSNGTAMFDYVMKLTSVVI